MPEQKVNKWHALTIEKVFALVQSSEHGLTEQEAGKRAEEFGLNEIAQKNGDRMVTILVRQFKNPLIIILIVAATVAWFLNDVIDTFIILAAVILNAVIGFGQEWKVSNILKELKKFISYWSTIIRSGRPKSVDSRNITIGDILVLRQGDRIPADARLFKVSNFKTNESILTGESMPVEKSLDVVDESIQVADRNDMVFMGTIVEEGTGHAVIVAIGDATEFGKISR